jgi:cytochrome c-type biogenesis protein CcmH
VIRRRLFPVVALAAALAACGRERPAPPPAPAAAPADPAPMRPLTSRDTGTSVPGASEGEPVEGEVRLDPRLTDKAQPDDVLYIIARGSASRQIVAVRKEEHVRFPFAFRLSSGDSMMPGTPFAGPFDLTARLSHSGDATPRPGDLEGTVKNVAAGSRGISVIVDTVRP